MVYEIIYKSFDFLNYHVQHFQWFICGFSFSSTNNSFRQNKTELYKIFMKVDTHAPTHAHTHFTFLSQVEIMIGAHNSVPCVSVSPLCILYLIVIDSLKAVECWLRRKSLLGMHLTWCFIHYFFRLTYCGLDF